MRQNIMAERCSRAVSHLRVLGKQRERQEVARAKAYLSNPLPLNRAHLPQLHHLPMVSSNFELINELNC
jgi:hypothetical protein